MEQIFQVEFNSRSDAEGEHGEVRAVGCRGVKSIRHLGGPVEITYRNGHKETILRPDLIKSRPHFANSGLRAIYIAGPMTGLPGYNHKAFDEAAVFYHSQGWSAINPIDLDLKFDGVDIRSLPINHDWDSMPATMNRDDIIRRDFEAVMASDAIALLPGWQESTGANAELRLAVWRGIEVRDFESDREAVNLG